MEPGIPQRAGPWVRGAVCGLALLVAAGGGARETHAEEDRKPPAAVNLLGGKIRDVPTTVSVPIDAARSLVLDLSESFWVQCPRYLPVPNSLAGQGLIVQFLNRRGGSPSLLYLGSEPLPATVDGETAARRTERAATAFVENLRESYRRVDFSLITEGLTLKPATLEVNGKKAAAWKPGRYRTRPAVAYGGPESVLDGECVLFQPEGTEVLVHLALDTKSSGTTLERALRKVRIEPTDAVNPTGRIVQINDLAQSAPGRFPVRLLSYRSPPGFLVAPSVLDLKGDLVYAEDRWVARGRVTGSHRIDQYPADVDSSPADDAANVRATYGKDAGPLREVALATPGTRAWVFVHPLERAGDVGLARTAVFRFDDLTMTFTWSTFGDAQQVEADGAAFDELLAGIQMAVRW